MTAPDIPIPPESRIAATDAMLQTGGDVVAAIRAAIKAWPGMKYMPAVELDQLMCPPVIILPLPQEPRHE